MAANLHAGRRDLRAVPLALVRKASHATRRTGGSNATRSPAAISGGLAATPTPRISTRRAREPFDITHSLRHIDALRASSEDG
jgi:hypothetical protein